MKVTPIGRRIGDNPRCNHRATRSQAPSRASTAQALAVPKAPRLFRKCCDEAVARAPPSSDSGSIEASAAAPAKAAALLNSARLCGIALLVRSHPADAMATTRLPSWSLRRSVAPARVARRLVGAAGEQPSFRRRPCAPRAGRSRSAKDSALPARLRRAPFALRAADLEFAPKLCGFRKSP